MYDFVAIGDTVIDAFIRLKEATVNCDVSEEHCTITMAFGDKIPYEFVEVVPAVGNSANAAVAAARLGLKSALVTHLGGDDNGKICLKRLEDEKVSHEFITIEDGQKTNYHYVLWYEHDRTILVKHEAYKYELPDLGEPKWLYLSSLGESTLEYQLKIAEYVKSRPNIKLAFQPGTFQLRAGKEKLGDLYKLSDIFFCNVEEAEEVLGINTLGTKELLKKMKDLGPKMVVITDGPKGAYAYDGENFYMQPAFPDQKPAYDRTGAGDAFASTCVIAVISGLDLGTAMQWGAINSMSVVQQVGAQKGLVTRDQLEEYLKHAPEEFKTKKLD